MTLRTRILSSNFVIAIFAVVLASVLYVNHAKEARELASFSKVSELLVLFIKTSESFTEESAASWAASPVFEDYSSEGIERYETQVKTTDEFFEQIHELVATLDLSQHSKRFGQLVQNGLNFKERVEPIRQGLRTGSREAWPSIQLYVEQVRWLIGLIPQLAIEAHDAELVRKMTVADAIMQMRINASRHTGLVIHNLKFGEVSEMVDTVCRAYIPESQALITKILANTTEEGVALYKEKLLTSDWQAILDATQLIIDAGSIRYGIDPPREFDPIHAPRTQESGDAFMQAIAVFKDFVLEDIESYTSERLASASWQKWQALVLGALCVGVCLSSGFFLASRLSATIGEISHSLHSKANEGLERSKQVARASQMLADGGASQAASIEEISATMEEMKAISDTNSEHVSNAQRIAFDTDQTANAGAKAMDEMGHAMKNIQESSSEISHIAKEIEEIAFQTNILALNAAVEAARAGEAGAGFAIVADEVRSLAQKSAISANSTREKITSAIRSVSEGTRITEQVHQHLDRILNQSTKFKLALEQVSQSSRQQNEGIGQVTQSIAQIDKVTQRNAASSEETSSAAEETRRQAETILEQIQKLDALVLGAKAPRPAQARHPLAPRALQARTEGAGPAPITRSRVQEEMWN